jgi:chromosome segregation ATPase
MDYLESRVEKLEGQVEELIADNEILRRQLDAAMAEADDLETAVEDAEAGKLAAESCVSDLVEVLVDVKDQIEAALRKH